jgi:hypothetical protein
MAKLAMESIMFTATAPLLATVYVPNVGLVSNTMTGAEAAAKGKLLQKEYQAAQTAMNAAKAEGALAKAAEEAAKMKYLEKVTKYLFGIATELPVNPPLGF